MIYPGENVTKIENFDLMKNLLNQTIDNLFIYETEIEELKKYKLKYVKGKFLVCFEDENLSKKFRKQMEGKRLATLTEKIPFISLAK